MSPSEHLAICDALRQLDPLTRLDEFEIDRLARDLELLQAVPGGCLLDSGSDDSRQLFLLDGELLLTAADGASHIVRASGARAKGPISRLRPSRYRVTARTPVRYLMLEQHMLETGAGSATGVVVEENLAYDRRSNGLLDESASHPLVFDVFSDLHLGNIVVPSPADVAVRVGDALQRYEDYTNDFAKSLGACPSLSLKVLRLARRVRGNRARPRTVRDAVTQIGTAQAVILSISCILRETLRADAAIIDARMRRWWERSVRVAAVCRVLARHSERFDPEYAAQFGLFHRIAEPVMLRYANRHPDLLDAAALDQVLHANRVEIGRILMSMWEMPRDLVDAVTHCNHWGYDHAGEADYTDILLVAQWFANQHDPLCEHAPEILNVPAFERLGLLAPSPETTAKIEVAAASAVDEIDALLGE